MQLRLAGREAWRMLGILARRRLGEQAESSAPKVPPLAAPDGFVFGRGNDHFVVPTGYSFNLDAFSIYLTLAVVFIAQATHTPLSLGDLLLLLGVSLFTSKGAHGLPGSVIVILAATLSAAPSIPAIGLVLVLSVDWFIGMGRALGSCVATVVIAAWEGDLDRAKAAQVLNGASVEVAEAVVVA